MSKLDIKIPDYLSIKDWKYYSTLEEDTDAAKMVNFVSYISDVEESLLTSMSPSDVKIIYNEVLKSISDVDSKFYPVIEIEGKLYGYQPLSKMTLGEYIDLERLAKAPERNLEDIMAILYRPIEQHSFKGIKWAVMNTYKTGTGNVENLFKYYEIEKYDSNKRPAQAETMASLPVSFALGAISFFLVLASTSLLGIQASSFKSKKVRKKMIEKVKETITVPIGDGLRQFIISLKLPSLQSQEIKVSQI